MKDPSFEDPFEHYLNIRLKLGKRWFPPGFWWIASFLCVVLVLSFLGGTVFRAEHKRRCDCEERINEFNRVGEPLRGSDGRPLEGSRERHKVPNP